MVKLKNYNTSQFVTYGTGHPVTKAYLHNLQISNQTKTVSKSIVTLASFKILHYLGNFPCTRFTHTCNFNMSRTSWWKNIFGGNHKYYHFPLFIFKNHKLQSFSFKMTLKLDYLR